jgi:hypothetical protein
VADTRRGRGVSAAAPPLGHVTVASDGLRTWRPVVSTEALALWASLYFALACNLPFWRAAAAAGAFSGASGVRVAACLFLLVLALQALLLCLLLYGRLARPVLAGLLTIMVACLLQHRIGITDVDAENYLLGARSLALGRGYVDDERLEREILEAREKASRAENAALEAAGAGRQLQELEAFVASAQKELKARQEQLDGLTRKTPKSSLQHVLGRDRALHRGAVRDHVRNVERQVRVSREQGKRSGPGRLGEQLRSQVCRADRIRLGDDGSATILVAADGEREAEGEDEPDDAEQRALHGAERFAQRLVVPPQPAAKQDAAGRDATDEGEDDQRNGPAAQ